MGFFRPFTKRFYTPPVLQVFSPPSSGSAGFNSNIRLGQSSLSNGVDSVNLPSVTANSFIFISLTSVGGVPGFLDITSEIGVGFSVRSWDVSGNPNNEDFSIYNWMVIEKES